MISSIVHQPCEVQLHLYSSDIFLHPPRPNSDLPGDDKTLHGLVEIRVPSERTIQGVKVTFQGFQTLAIPERAADSPIIQTRYEDKTLLEKVVEITTDGTRSSNKSGKGKGKERQSDHLHDEGQQLSSLSLTDATTTTHGIHLEKGVHGFEFAFIIPASSAPFERGRYGRVRYTLTATALGAGRGRAAVSVSREIFLILHVNADGGPVPLDIQYHDVHEALGAMSISLTSASLTVGGAATLSIYHPTPPPGLSVHVVRVFLEQTIELYSEVRKAWMKLPTEKLRVWERGYMPNKEAGKQIDPNVTMDDSFWIRNEQDPTLPGRPGRAVIAGGFGVPTLAPYGASVHPGFSGGALSGGTVSHQSSPMNSHPTTPGGHGSNANVGSEGYKVKAVMRLPDDNQIRPSSVRGSRAEIRVSHELGVEVFFSRASVLDDRPNSETFGKPKVQVFSMRRATIIPSCCATYDTIHLPPYSLESPMTSRPPSPGPASSGGGRGRASAININPSSSASGNQPPRNASQSELDHWRLTQTLKAALGGHANAGTGASGNHSADRSLPGSTTASRSSSPTRAHHSNGSSGGALASTFSYFSNHHHHGRRSRPASPIREAFGGGGASATVSGTHSPSGNASPVPHRKPGTPSGLHALTPSHRPVSSLTNGGAQSNTFPTIITAPASGTTTPKTLPANSPWALGNFPVRTSTSHESCQCGRSTEELMEAEQRLLEGAPTAPGIWIDAHDEGQLPPPWTPSRPSSPVLDGASISQDVSGWYRGDDGTREGGRARGKIGEMAMSAPGAARLPPHAVEEQDSDDDGGHL